MKKAKVLVILLAVLAVLAAGVCGAAYYFVRQAQDMHASCEALRALLHTNLAESRLCVTENGEAVGEFSFSSLRTDDVAAQLDAMFSATDRLTAGQFAALSWPDQLRWYNQSARTQPAAWYQTLQSGSPMTLALNSDAWDFAPVFDALDRTPRTAAQDAYPVFSAETGAYEIVPEQPGTELAREAVAQALTDAMSGAIVSSVAADERSFELTSCACYVPPEITQQAEFDYAELLRRDAEDLSIEVDLMGQPQQLRLLDYLSADGKGRVQIDEDKLTALLQRWAEQSRLEATPYLFDSYDRGVVPVSFLTCNYDLDTDALYDQLAAQLVALDTAPIEAPFLCTDMQGELFGLKDTYIAVDIEAQTVTFYKDGALIVHSDVVTGLPGGRDTPKGLYQVLNLEHDCWLTGPDFYVFVKYWVGFLDGLYGLHDASWREEFGGERYLTNGSHGCVNTPEEAMRTIYETVEVGTPVLVFS